MDFNNPKAFYPRGTNVPLDGNYRPTGRRESKSSPTTTPICNETPNHEAFDQGEELPQTAVRPWPRLMTEKLAGDYIGRSASWMRNMRYSDSERIAQGEPPLGPAFIKQGRSVRYPIDYLDEWVDQFIVGEVKGWSTNKENTEGLLNKKQRHTQQH